MTYYTKLLNDLWIALRPLSLSLALGSTTTGILIAHKHGYAPRMFLILLVTFAGILAQAGANLINDYFEGSFRYHRKAPQAYKFLGKYRSKFDILVFLLGMSSFGLAAVIGLYLVYQTDVYMLLIGILGLIGGYAYTGEPFVYKRRGLGMPLSFVVMGPLMVIGAYYAVTATFDYALILYSLPISFLIPALMLSNELRDFYRDKGLSLGTLTVRVGSTPSKILYIGLLFSSYTSTIVLILMKRLSPWGLIVLLTLPMASQAYKSVATHKGLGIPKTNKLHFFFSLLYLISLLIHG